MTNRAMLSTGPTGPDPLLPRWLMATHPQTAENAAFLSGAALARLDQLLRDETLPQALLRARLALAAAEACTAFAGRSERASALRDAILLIRQGDLPGPAGEICRAWQRAVEKPVSLRTLQRALPDEEPGRLAAWLGAARGAPNGGPVARAAEVLETTLTDAPRAETPATMLADAALARALGWDHLVPLLATGLKRADLRKRGAALQLACHQALHASALRALRLTEELRRGAARLREVTPKLRARGAGEAVALFLRRDALVPSDMPMSDRAARRLCDRLVALGAVRELTGRDTFRIYGV
jgi:hypothetical protein